MTAPRYRVVVPAGSSLSFTSADGTRLDVPAVGLLDRVIELEEG